MIIGAVIDSYGKYGIGENPIIFDNLDCFGHEKTLLKCSKTTYPNFTCSDNNIVGLLCLESKFYTNYLYDIFCAVTRYVLCGSKYLGCY